MRRTTLSRLSAVCLVLAALVCAEDAWGAYGAYDGTATYVYRQAFYLEQGQTYNFETKNLSAGGDTVMYLWSEDQQQQVAYNDDTVGLASHIEYGPSTSGIYLLIVRAYSNDARGHCEIWFQNQLHVTTVFAGWMVEAGNSSNDSYSTVELLGGISDAYLYVFDSWTMELRGKDDDSGLKYMAKWTTDQANSRFVAVSMFALTGEAGVRLLINDAGHDSDGDGIGPALEQGMCSCDNTSMAYSCDRAGTSKWVDCSTITGVLTDTDNDGLDDDWEIIGIDDATFPQTLVKWGADPARKDVFVEMDWMKQLHKMSTTVADEVAQIYNAAGTAVSLANPDGSDGVKVHLDIGQPPPCTDHTNPTCTSRGSWGGGQLISQPYWTCSNDNSVHQTTQPTCPGGTARQGGYEYHSYQAFAAQRRGVFHYAIIHRGTGAGFNHNYRFNANGGSPGTVAHELGHNLDLEHHGSVVTGSANCKPNYQSLMNYAPSATFSQNTLTYQLNPSNLCEADGIGTSDLTKMTTLQGAPFNYLVQQQPGGIYGVDWNRDGLITDCSVVVRAPVNSTKLLNPGTPVDCEWSRYRMNVPITNSTTLLADQTPDLVHVVDTSQSLDRTYLFYTDNAASMGVHYVTSDSDFNEANPSGCPALLEQGCGSWSSPVQLSDTSTPPRPGTGPAAAVFSTTQVPGPYIAVAWQVPLSPSAKLYYKVINPVSGAIQSQGWVPGSEDVTHEPSMVAYDGGVLLAFRKTDGYLWISQMTSASCVFTSPSLSMVDQYPVTISTSPSLASYLHGSTQKLRAVLVNSAQEIFWIEQTPNLGWNAWTDVTAGSGLESTASFKHHTKYKVGFAWVPNQPGGTPGRFFIVWADADNCTGDNCNAKLDYTRGDGTGFIPAKFENMNYADNQWFSSFRGFSLFLDPNIDDNLRMVSVYRKKDLYDGQYKQNLHFRPFADGRFPVQLKDNDDFMVMRTGLCVALHGCDTNRCGSNPLSSGYPCPGKKDGP